MHGMHGMSGPMWMPDVAPSFVRLVATHLQPVPLFPALCVILLCGYAVGIGIIRHRGGRWPMGKTLAFAAGLVVLWQVTATGIEGYGMMLFSVHMFQHMMLTMTVPILLLAGAPVTLALRALPTHGVSGIVRRAIVTVLHSRVARILLNPAVRWFLFLSGLYGIYFTSLFDWLMSNVWGHYLMLGHFLVTGLVFFAPLVAADPVPGRARPVFRILELFVSTPFHAFFGIALMMASTPIVSFFMHPPGSWGVDVMGDQNTAGAIAWAFSEVPTLMVMAVVFAQWVRAERRTEARRERRSEAETAELAAYNAYLADLNRRD